MPPLPTLPERIGPVRATRLFLAARADVRGGHPTAVGGAGALTPAQMVLRADASAQLAAEHEAAEADSGRHRVRIEVIEAAELPQAEALVAEARGRLEQLSALTDGPVAAEADLPDDLRAARSAQRRARELAGPRAELAAAGQRSAALRQERADCVARSAERSALACARARLLVARANRDEAYYRAHLLRRHPDGRRLAAHWPTELVSLPGWAHAAPGLRSGVPADAAAVAP